MAQSCPVCSKCEGEKTANWTCVNCDIFMCESCNEKHSNINPEHLSTYKNEKTNLIQNLKEETDDKKFTQIRCAYHKDYYCTDVCVECVTLICAKCRYENHARHKLEFIETFYQNKRTELSKCKSIIEKRLISKAKEGGRLVKYVESYHVEHFEKEKNKVLTQAEALKRKITDRSHDVVQRLEDSLQNYRITSYKNNHQLEKIEQNSKTKAEEIHEMEQNLMKSIQTQNEDKLKNVLGKIKGLLNKVESNTKQCDIPILISRSVKKFNPKEIGDEAIDKALGDIVDCSILDEVSIRKVSSFDITNSYSNSSLAVSKDGTIWFGNSNGLGQITSNGTQNPSRPIKKMYDVSFLESKGILIAYTEKGSIDILDNKGTLNKFYEKPNGRMNALALHVCRDDRIIILTWSDYFFLGNSVTLHIIELTRDGKFIKSIRCQGNTYQLPAYDVFRISENINGHFCVSCQNDSKIVDHNNKGDMVWVYRRCYRPFGIVTTKLGNIVTAGTDQFIHILNSEGNFLTKLNVEEHIQTEYLFALILDSDNRLLILSENKLTLLEFSTIV